MHMAVLCQVKHKTVKTSKPGPNGEQYVWWQCTVKGGREGRDIGAVELAQAVEALGAGEILLNCIDNDGAGKVSRGVSELWPHWPNVQSVGSTWVPVLIK
jgi:imidazole glycerol phosphate synthase subunit HisF